MSEHLPPPALIRRLIRHSAYGTLATIHRAADGAEWPYASLVASAADTDGTPILLLSELAEHTRNLKSQPRVSLLYDVSGRAAGGRIDAADRLAQARVTLLGRAAHTTDPRCRARYIAHHPQAESYASFRDFAFYRIEPERAHLVAGFARVIWVEGAELRLDAAIHAAVVAAEAGIADHMNTDHADALDLYARALLGEDGNGWRVAGVDPEGIDLRREDRCARLDFAAPVADANGVRAELVRLAKEARAR